MKLNHIHLGVRDLRAALDWFDHFWQLKPEFQNDRMATMRPALPRRRRGAEPGRR